MCVTLHHVTLLNYHLDPRNATVPLLALQASCDANAQTMMLVPAPKSPMTPLIVWIPAMQWCQWKCCQCHKSPTPALAPENHVTPQNYCLDFTHATVPPTAPPVWCNTVASTKNVIWNLYMTTSASDIHRCHWRNFQHYMSLMLAPWHQHQYWKSTVTRLPPFAAGHKDNRIPSLESFPPLSFFSNRI